MTTVLEKKYTKDDSPLEILEAIRTLADDKNHRLFIKDDEKWQRTKFKEISRLSTILIKREEKIIRMCV